MAMTPLQSVLWDVKQRIENDKKLSKLRQKVNSGKATYADTAAYSTHVGNLLGDTFAQHILSVSPELREALTVELLHDRYMDINAIIDRAQKSMDEAQGLHLAPQHAPFYDDRAHQIGSALADPTVPDETIKRRARAATATATKSMHDDRMKTEAKFRSRAGLKCTVNRVAAAKCCEWCDQVAGKYAYEDTPPDLWRRHDNCNCTIVYDTRRDRQVLRGTEKKWEIVAEGVGAPEPVRLTPEQARKLQEKHQLKRLTNGEVRGTIRAITVDDFELRTYGKGIMEEVEKAIFSGMQLAEKRSGAIVSDILISHIPPTKAGREAILTEIMPNGLLRMTFNEDVFSGLSLDDINAIFNGTESILANSLEEAMIHESGHLKYMTGKKPSEVEKIHSELAKEHIKGISKYAEKDGAECIAEVEVMLYRGEDVPEDAMKLYRRYIKGA